MLMENIDFVTTALIPTVNTKNECNKTLTTIFNINTNYQQITLKKGKGISVIEK